MSDNYITKLQPATDGRQADPGVTMDSFAPGPPIVVPTAIRPDHPEDGVMALSQAELAKGLFSAHPRRLILRRGPSGQDWAAYDIEDIVSEKMARVEAWVRGRRDAVLDHYRSELQKLGVRVEAELEAAALRLLLGL